jgi:hypothetical protein
MEDEFNIETSAYTSPPSEDLSYLGNIKSPWAMPNELVAIEQGNIALGDMGINTPQSDYVSALKSVDSLGSIAGFANSVGNLIKGVIGSSNGAPLSQATQSGNPNSSSMGLIPQAKNASILGTPSASATSSNIIIYAIIGIGILLAIFAKGR